MTFIVVPVLCAVIGFAVGRHTSAREPLYFIGTPVDLAANGVASDAGNTGTRNSTRYASAEQLVISPSAADAMCGARTKSGNPCKRKVKGGGYCWQHRAGLTRQRDGSPRH